MTPSWISPSLRQTWCISSVIIGIIGQGMLMGHTGFLLSALQSQDSPIKTDLHSASWLASVTGPAVFIGAISSCVMMDKFGRRWAYLLSIAPGILGWIILYLAGNYSMLFLGRLLTGTTLGGVITVGVIAIGEYASPENRGMFLNLKTAAFTSGSAIVHILGSYMHWRTIAIIILIPHTIAVLITFTWPESPTWLATRKQFDKCEKDFFWLRGINARSTKEVNEIIKAQKISQHNKKTSVKAKILALLRKFTRKDFLKPFFTLTVSHFLMEASGRHYFPTYAGQIMAEALNTKTLPYYYTFCIDLIITISCTISSVLMRVMKRRILLFSTGIASLLVLICMCLYLFLISMNLFSSANSWIITFIFIIYFFLSNLACGPMPVSLQGELFPVAHREFGSAIYAIVNSLVLTVVMKITPHLLVATKIYGTFAIYAVITGIALLILYFILPETKNRTLQEIENYYNYGRFTNIDEKANLLAHKEHRCNKN